METTKRVWVAATLDTKRDEANYVCTLLEAAGVPVALADLSTSGRSVRPDTRIHFSPEDIAAYHPQSRSAVFSGDRGAAIGAMTDAFERFVKARDDIGGMLGLGGSGGTAMITRAMRALPIGVPKIMVSTMASGNVAVVCRRLRYHNDVLRYRYGRPEPNFTPCTRKRRACFRGHDAARVCHTKNTCARHWA